MPIPLRPMKDIHQNIPNTSFSDGGAFSPLQKIFLGVGAADAQQRVIKLQPMSKVDDRDTELLHRIWLANDNNSDMNRSAEDQYEVPEDISDYDLIRLKTEGYIVGKGRDVEFTESGHKVVKKKILEAASIFDLDRTREKYDPEAVRRS